MQRSNGAAAAAVNGAGSLRGREVFSPAALRPGDSAPAAVAASAPRGPCASPVRDNVPARLDDVYRRIDRSTAVCFASNPDRAGEMRQDTMFVDWSPLSKALEEVIGGPEDCWQLLHEVATADAGCGAAMACLVGLAIGDAVGHPLEFTPVDQRLPDAARGFGPQRPCLLPRLQNGRLLYQRQYNKFGCRSGQWTDDTSMALCIADSLLVHEKFHGGDLRCRWHMWWTHGYCNAFRYDNRRPFQTSVGLGGNISKSLAELERSFAGVKNAAEMTPPVYASDRNDAGNGSIMRLAAVPIAMRLSTYGALDVATLSSLATHPGTDAAACALFVAYFVTRALDKHCGGPSPGSDVRGFVDYTIRTFSADYCSGERKKSGLDTFFAAAGSGHKESLVRLGALLMCQPPSPKEQNWNWKLPELPIEEAMRERHLNSWGVHNPQATYNGHPIIATYFGSYCMDGLAMALWSLWNSSNFSSCIQSAVNLLGDADTIGAIAGQLAGALYGWAGIVEDVWGRERLVDLRTWDPQAEVGIRAALLYHCFPRPQARVRQAEGHAAVRVFAGPANTERIIGELASGEVVHILDQFHSFVRIQTGTLIGWVGRKNTVYMGVNEFLSAPPKLPPPPPQDSDDSDSPPMAAMPASRQRPEQPAPRRSG